MRFLLPVDSRLTNTQGFITLDESGTLIDAVISEEQYAYARKGFRGACVVDDRLYVCNSFSLKIYCVTRGRDEGDAPQFELLRQTFLPEYLIGRGANADLHFPYHDAENGHILVANSYMDCIDTFSLGGDFLGRKFLWEISPSLNYWPGTGIRKPQISVMSIILSASGMICCSRCAT